MHRYDRWCGLLGLVFSIFICIVSMRASIGTLTYPGPGFLSFLGGASLGVLSIVLIITSGGIKKSKWVIGDLWRGKKWRNTIWVTLSIFLYAILLPILGYLISTFGLMTLLLSFLGKPRWGLQLLGAFVTSMATYLIFHIWLDIHLPTGPFGF